MSSPRVGRMVKCELIQGRERDGKKDVTISDNVSAGKEGALGCSRIAAE